MTTLPTVQYCLNCGNRYEAVEQLDYCSDQCGIEASERHFDALHSATCVDCGALATFNGRCDVCYEFHTYRTNTEREMNEYKSAVTPAICVDCGHLVGYCQCIDDIPF